MERLAYLQSQWQRENRIAEQGLQAAIEYRKGLKARREDVLSCIFAAAYGLGFAAMIIVGLM